MGAGAGFGMTMLGEEKADPSPALARRVAGFDWGVGSMGAGLRFGMTVVLIGVEQRFGMTTLGIALMVWSLVSCHPEPGRGFCERCEGSAFRS